VELWFEILPWLLAMLVLIALSAFFSGGEACLFSLRKPERLRLAAGTRAQRLAAALLDDSDRLLSAVLFWNLMINMTYFAVASIISFRLERASAAGSALPFLFAAASLLTLILFSEMLPKTLAVLSARLAAGFFAPPLAVAVRVASPILPVLQLMTLLSRRLMWPRFKPEPYLEIADLARAIDASTTDAQLAEQEQLVLNNIVAMSDIRVDEWMRPRTQFLSFRPPVDWLDLQGRLTPSGYLLVTDRDGDEVCGAVDLLELYEMPAGNLDRNATPIVYLPWCATIADAFQQLYQLDRDVAAVVNEFGDTIGILTYEDILDAVFADKNSRSERLMNRQPIERVGDGVWHVTGVTGLRQLAQELDVELPPSRSATVAGVLHEALQRLPVQGDTAVWGPLALRVIESADCARMLVELTLRPAEADEEAPS
jgi:putative hemolysin